MTSAKPSPQWLDYPHDECPMCGFPVQILTACSQQDTGDIGEGQMPPYAYCGDTWKCEEGHEGTIYCDSETLIQLEGGA